MSSRLQIAVAVTAVIAFAWVARRPASPPAAVPAPAASAARDGLSLRDHFSLAGRALVADLRIENTRDRPVYLKRGTCGAVGEVTLARARPEPEGRLWTGSVQALKRVVVDRYRGRPARFTPRGIGPCAPRARPLKLAAHDVVRERWELTSSLLLNSVGSGGLVISAEIEEGGRRLAVTRPAAQVVTWPATGTGPEYGALFDRVLADARLRRAVAAQPVDGWLDAQLLQDTDGTVRFSALSRAYERRFRATARADGTVVDVQLPGAADRTRSYPTRPATRPPGIGVIKEPLGYVLTRDVLVGRVALPSGRLVADGTLIGDAEPSRHRVPPGSYPVRVTLARHPQGGDTVALATLVASRRPTVAWRREHGVGTDTATGVFTSVEGERWLGDLIHRDGDAWQRRLEASFDALQVNPAGATELPLGHGENMIMFTTGSSDGGYPMWVGLDAQGRPTRFVLDFFVVHLRWPRGW